MSVLKAATVKTQLLITALAALFAVACGGSDERAALAGNDVGAGDINVAGQPLRCENGAVQSCTIWLGQHGDLNNCVHGLDVCSDGVWSGCIDETTIAENPELYGELAGELSAVSETP